LRPLKPGAVLLRRRPIKMSVYEVDARVSLSIDSDWVYTTGIQFLSLGHQRHRARAEERLSLCDCRPSMVLWQWSITPSAKPWPYPQSLGGMFLLGAGYT